MPHLKSLSTPVRNEFADALHKEGLVLTVFIAGCCGWADPNTTAPAGHCADAIATHDFCGATCLDWRNSSVDWVLSGATYSGTMRNSARSPRGADNLKALVGNAARGELHALGVARNQGRVHDWLLAGHRAQLSARRSMGLV
eukprot:COSAG01_NODE_650_length_14506_cov_24.157354_11_plen_142_part_00